LNPKEGFASFMAALFSLQKMIQADRGRSTFPFFEVDIIFFCQTAHPLRYHGAQEGWRRL
jgi:hypothetical protein